jgi:CRP-like cAMP-binding protein
LGLLVLSGALLRTLSLGGRTHAELLGPGDVIRSAAGERDASWRVIAPTELAMLDRSLCRWPSVIDTLLHRAANRSHALAAQLAITDLRRAEDRVLALLRALADRWGKPGPSGVTIDVPLTHEMIAMLVGTHRPAVTTAVHRLDAEGRLRRTLDGWSVSNPADVRPVAA